ncbi:heat shock factor-binding protein [Hypoxylon fuscum]|nr:heat shock factor-binding protein [Hypoxylon fuscum]
MSSNMKNTDAAPSNTSSDLILMLEAIDSISTQFANMSNEMFTKLDEMQKRLDSLERALRANGENGTEPTPNA